MRAEDERRKSSAENVCDASGASGGGAGGCVGKLSGICEVAGDSDDMLRRSQSKVWVFLRQSIPFLQAKFVFFFKQSLRFYGKVCIFISC